MRNPRLVIALAILTAVIVAVMLFVQGGGLRLTAGTAPEGTAPYPVPDAAVPATVEYVHDGDTLFLTDGTKVRLLGIDTPEIGDDAECFGREATEALRTMVPDGSRVRVLADVQPLDQYGRSLLFIYTADGELVNLQLIEEGMAEAVVLPPNELFADELEAAEDRAQSANLGMWGAC